MELPQNRTRPEDGQNSQNGKKQKRQWKGFSLRWALIGTIVLCWMLPMILVILTITQYATGTAKRQLDDTLQESTANAAYISRRTLEEVVASSRMPSYDKIIETAWDNYQNHGQRRIFYDAISDYLRNNYKYDNNLTTTTIFLTSEPENLYYIQNYAVESAYQRILEYEASVHPKVMRMAAELDTGIGFIAHGRDIYMVRNILDKSFNPFAVIVLKMNLPVVFLAFENNSWNTTTTIYLNGVPMMLENDGDDDWTAPEFPELELAPRDQKTIETNHYYIIYGRQKMDRVNFTYSVEIDKGHMDTLYDELLPVFTFIILLVIPFMLFAIWFFYQNIFLPITRLNSAAKTIQEGNLGYQLPGKMGNPEFTELQDAFNSMSSRLKRQFEQIYSEELALRDARIMALQSQINPHFLNNTLEIINWEARLADNLKISRMIEALATMLDAAMDRGGDPVIPLTQELSYVDAYLYIIGERFGKRLTVEKHIDPALLQQTVPRLIMQPIIENAVEHGMTPQGTCNITIRAMPAEGGMFLEVENSARMNARDEQRVAKLLSPGFDAGGEGSLSLGIRNVNIRLKMIYGEEAGLAIFSTENSTISKITIPFV